jgi:uncharacterized protein
MAKPTGAMCNLACKYCFYTPKKKLYPYEDFRMSDETLKEYVKQYIEAIKIPEVTFAWQGGEPTLMGIDFFKKAIKYQNQYKKDGMKIYNTIQTNGTLLNDEWCQFFLENNFLVGISIDGPPKLHDTYRVDKEDKSSFDRVMNGFTLLKKLGVEFNILTTVNRTNADHPLEVYKFFRDELKVKFIQFIPIVEQNNGDSGVSEESLRPEQYGKFLISIFDEWLKNDVGEVFVQIFDATLASWVDYPPAICIFAPTCGTAMIIEHNGDLYSCDHFVDSEHLLGNIMETPIEELVSSPQQFHFGLDKTDTLSKECIQCDFKFACWGSCPKHRFSENSDEKNLNYLCTDYKMFFSHIKWPMQIMASLFNQGRDPADIMQIFDDKCENLSDIFPDVGPNDLCPCESLLKFKKCHGKS